MCASMCMCVHASVRAWVSHPCLSLAVKQAVGPRGGLDPSSPVFPYPSFPFLRLKRANKYPQPRNSFSAWSFLVTTGSPALGWPQCWEGSGHLSPGAQEHQEGPLLFSLALGMPGRTGTLSAVL